MSREIAVIGLDLAKIVFQVHAIDCGDKPLSPASCVERRSRITLAKDLRFWPRIAFP